MIYTLLYKILTNIINCLKSLTRIEAQLETLSATQRRFEDELLGVREQLAKILEAVIPLPATRIVMTANLEGQISEGITTMKMTNSQKVRVTIQPVDKHGNPAAVDGVPSWASSDETIITIVADADGLGADISAVGPDGDAKASVTADADLGAGTTPIFGTLDFTITPGAAVGINLTAGVPVEQ